VRVLHLPFNIASQISATVRALRDIGVEARGLVSDNADIQDATAIEQLPQALSCCRHPIRRMLQRWANRRTVLDAIRWSDVVHWHYSWALPSAFDVRYASRLGKAGIVEFWGSEIRIAEIAAADNPYMARMYHDHPDLGRGTAERSLETQGTFANGGVACLIPGPELLAYVSPTLFPSPYRIRQRLALQDYAVAVPDPGRKRPLIIHMPSHKVKKGTDAVLRAVEELRQTHDFDFRLIHGVKRSEALKVVQTCDVFLDQFVGGDHGLAALESMAFGKVTVCYIKPALRSAYPAELPLVIASQDDLVGVLEGLLENGLRRQEIGRQSRAYVEKYHDSRLLATQLRAIYEELQAKPRRGQSR
jgi:hypothetical protein